MARKKEYEKMKNDEHGEYGGRGRFGSVHLSDDDGVDSGEQREWKEDEEDGMEDDDMMDEMFGRMEDDEEEEVPVHHGHIEL